MGTTGGGAHASLASDGIAGGRQSGLLSHYGTSLTLGITFLGMAYDTICVVVTDGSFSKGGHEHTRTGS